MLKLSPKADTSFSLDLLPGVRVQVKPISVAMMLVARREAARIAQADPDGDAQTLFGMGLVASLAHQGIEAWEGVGDQDGSPLAVSTENVDMLLDIVPAFDAIDRLYVTPALAVETEKNG